MRPPAEASVRPVDRATLDALAARFRPRAEVIADFSVRREEDAPTEYVFFDSESMKPKREDRPIRNTTAMKLHLRALFSSHGEILQAAFATLRMAPNTCLLFDEPESGVDLENMALIGNTARTLLDGAPAPTPDTCMRDLRRRNTTSGLIITHTGYILDYVNADRGQVMYNGVLCCDTRPTRPRDILDHISKYGYKECIRCLN